ncbi:carbon-nitrogen family hydrolase [Brevibacterium daeguense]|uniref:Carbon-nitrogen family hydrolase n=1 Tax=Brevibacterium daeguense TaxID=909936 RepID=A0ABP8EI01_9MICO|nr:nitrilase-related carbon-nitrogen hydrolase [Brevibacterium daeguense]
MRVSAIQLSYTDEDSQPARIERAVQLVRAQRGSDLVVLPELWSPGGFSYRDWGRRAETVESGPTVQALSAVAREIGAYVHLGSILEADAEALERIAAHDYDVTAMPELPDGSRGLWNTSVVVSPAGEVVARYRKIHRFGFGSGEPKLIEAGQDIVTVPLDVDGRTVTLGLATCYDLRFPELFRALLDAGAEVVAVPAAWPAPRVDHWSLFSRARAAEDFFALVACNTAGYHAGTEMGGQSVIVDASGSVLAEAASDETVIVADIDIDAIHERRRSFPALHDRRLNLSESR